MERTSLPAAADILAAAAAIEPEIKNDRRALHRAP